LIVDTSAIMAIVRQELTAGACARALETATSLAISSATYVELHVVGVRSREPIVQQAIAVILNRYPMEIAAFTATQANIANTAYGIYGRGQEHPAKLNFGDCFAYALARERNEPLLFVGDDFTHTDIRSALA
jgi:ribonuclease VapC